MDGSVRTNMQPTGTAGCAGADNLPPQAEIR